MPEEQIKPPEHGTTVEYEEHIARYRFAADFVSGDSTGLDIACGTGYGTDLLAQKGRSFYGVDKSCEAISYAQGHYKDQRLAFVCSDALKADFEKDRFDIIVSFETIEHLEEGDGGIFLRKLHDFLHKDGMIIISCPNKDTYPAGYNKNEFHIHEYSYGEIASLISKYFPNVEVYCQEMRYFRRPYKKIAQFLSHMPERLIKPMLNIAKNFYERKRVMPTSVFMRILLYEYHFKYDVFRFVEDYKYFKPVFFIFKCKK